MLVEGQARRAENSVADAARFCVSLLGASMPHVPFLGARKIVLSTCVHGLRAYHVYGGQINCGTSADGISDPAGSVSVRLRVHPFGRCT